MRDQISAFILESLAARRDITTLAPDDSLIESGVIDSLGIFRLMAFLEEEFNIVIADDEVTPANFRTLAAVEAFVRSKQAGTLAG